MLNVFLLCQMSSLLAVAIAQDDKKPTTCWGVSDICKRGKLCWNNTHGDGGIRCHCDDGFNYNKESGSCEADTFQTYCGILEQICENGRVCKNTQREDMMTCKCNVGFRYSTDNRRCEAVKIPSPHDCRNLENQCTYGRPCFNTSRIDWPVNCKCDDGFVFNSTTRKCEAKSGAAETECVPIENVCENGRICIDITRDSIVTCECDAGFKYNRETGTCEGDTILSDCVNSVIPCKNGRLCTNNNNARLFRCECKDGFIYNPLTGHCEGNIECRKQLKECTQDHCINNYRDGGFHCYCHNGYTLVHDKEITLTSSAMCRDIDECSDEGYVCPEGYCQIINGEIKCTCDNENTLESSALCSDGDECDSNKDLCPYGECINTIGSYKCQCLPGFELTANGNCTDINECNGTRKPCLNAECLNIEGSYVCQCFNGFQLTDNGICQDINECNGTRTLCLNAECVNMEGSYSCQCFEGFKPIFGGICESILTTIPTTDIRETPTSPQDAAMSDTTSKLPSSESSILNKYQSESSKIPMPAIVVPVILIIVGFGLLGFFLWRKRCCRYKKADQARTFYENNQITITSGSHMENLQDRDSVGSEDDKEPENTYTTIEIIDTADVFQHIQTKNISLKDKDNEISQTDNHDYHILEVKDAHASIDNDSVSCISYRNRNNEALYQTSKNRDTMHKDTHDYCVLEPEYTHLSSDLSKESSELQTGQNDALRNQKVQSSEPGDSESNTYFILEPSSAGSLRNGNERIDDSNLNRSNTNDLHSQTSSLEKENHDYFVLESEGRNPSYVSQDRFVIGNASTCACQETSDYNDIDTAGNHDYFILESQTKVPCPELKVSQIQTLPDNEYNVLKLKSKGSSQDYFTASKSSNLVAETDRNTSEANAGEYSHVNFNGTASEDEHPQNCEEY